MSIYLSLDGNTPSFLCSNTGWGDFSRWAATLAAPTLQHLCAYGWEEDLPAITQQLQQGLQAARPEPPTIKVAYGLLRALQHSQGTVLTITNGMGPEEVPQGNKTLPLDSSEEESENHAASPDSTQEVSPGEAYSPRVPATPQLPVANTPQAPQLAPQPDSQLHVSPLQEPHVISQHVPTPAITQPPILQLGQAYVYFGGGCPGK